MPDIALPPNSRNGKPKREAEGQKVLPGVRDHIGVVAEQRDDKRKLWRIVFLTIAGYPIFIALCVYFATLPKQDVFVVQRDMGGNYTPIGPITEMSPPTNQERRAAIGHWLEDLYVVTDARSQQHYRQRVWGMVAANSQAEQVINTFYRTDATNPDVLRAKKYHNALQINSVDSTDDSHFSVDYSVKYLDGSNYTMKTDQLHARVELLYNKDLVDSAVLWFNPQRVFITLWDVSPARV